MIKSKILLLLILCFLVSKFSIAQQSISKKKYRNNPVWIQMMNDPTANYFETIKAFREFWKEKKLPCEAGEEEGMDAFEVEVGLKDANKIESKREKRREERNNKDAKMYAYEVKQFKGWVQRVKPWVKPDGTIMTLDEQQKLIDQQRNELKEIEIKNKH
ncbi:MAG: hypothetical protein RL708_333 [Bacteroidota bacterium]|jgi:hypothetical protein